MVEARVTNLIFIGILLTPDLQYQLEKSLEWKRYRILEGDKRTALQRIPYKGKEYLGCYINETSIEWNRLTDESSAIREKLPLFFDDINVDKMEIVIVNQQILNHFRYT